jgi:hypothetical protein
VTLDALKNRKKHSILIENIRKEIKRLEELECTVFFKWVKAHTGIHGNEMADRLATEAATENTGEIVYDKIPRETIITEGKEIGLTKWQEQWTGSTKGAVSKLFFPSIKESMKTILPVSLEFTAIVTGRGLNRSYLHNSRLFQIPHAPADYKKNRQLIT